MKKKIIINIKMSVMQHIFYKHSHLDTEQKIELMHYAKEQSYEWWVDILDCNVSFARQRIEMSFEDILSKFDNSCHFVIIHRKGFISDNFYVEIGFSTMVKAPDYFLWIHLKEEKLSKLIEKYKLREEA